MYSSIVGRVALCWTPTCCSTPTQYMVRCFFHLYCRLGLDRSLKRIQQDWRVCRNGFSSGDTTGWILSRVASVYMTSSAALMGSLANVPSSKAIVLLAEATFFSCGICKSGAGRSRILESRFLYACLLACLLVCLTYGHRMQRPIHSSHSSA